MTRSVYATLLLASVACLCLNAQTIDLKANIPFEFRMGKAVMPAGSYLVHCSGPVLTLRTESGKAKSAVVLVRTNSSGVADPVSKLVFNRYGDDYFLAKVRDSRSGTEQALWPSAAEKELISRSGLVQTAKVTLQTK